MLLLVTQAIPQMHEFDHPNLGRLLTPRHCCSLAQQGRWPWAADNDCYRRFDPLAYTRMLDRLATAPEGCLFVTVPDVVGDARATAWMFEVWWRALGRRGLPAALVAQDGLERLDGWLQSAWPRVDALFIGASTAWKLGVHAERLAGAARERGKWVHMGRVNSARRIRYAASIGCDSVDGTGWVRWRHTNLDRGLRDVSAPAQLRFGAMASPPSGARQALP